MRYEYLIPTCSHACRAHVCAHHMFTATHDRQFLPPSQLSACAKTRMGIFKFYNYTLCRVRGAKLLGWQPRLPNLTPPVHLISMGNKAKPFRQIWNKHIQTFCVSHLGTTNGFSSNGRLKIHAYSQQHPSLSKCHSRFASHEVALYLPYVVLTQIISPFQLLMAPATQCDVPPITRRMSPAF